jgi:hypothetical protein
MDSSLFKRAYMQEHIWSALIWANKSKAPIGIPPYQRADGHYFLAARARPGSLWRAKPLAQPLHTRFWIE